MARLAIVITTAVTLMTACDSKSAEPDKGVKKRTASGHRVTIKQPPGDASVQAKPEAKPPATPSRRHTCTSNADCVISCVRPRSCCPQLCQCSIAYHKDQLAAIKADNAVQCARRTVSCPKAKCKAPQVEVVPTCSGGRCIAVDLPRGSKVRGGFLMLPGSPPPQACTSASDCVGDTVPAANGCCNDPRRIVPQSKAYKQFVHRWRTTRQQSRAGPKAVPCKGVECMIAPPPSKPKPCLFKMQCKNKRCGNSC